MWPVDQVIKHFSFYMALSESPVLGTQPSPVRSVGACGRVGVCMEGRGPITAQAEPAWWMFFPTSWRGWEAAATSDSSGQDSWLPGGAVLQARLPLPSRVLMFQAYGTWGSGHWSVPWCGQW